MRLTNARRSNLNASWLVLVSRRQVTFAWGNPFLRFRSVLDLVRDGFVLAGTRVCHELKTKEICSSINHGNGKRRWTRQDVFKAMRFK